MADMFAKNSVTLVDGSFLLHRSLAHKVYSKFATPQGIPTGGVFGFIETVRRLIKENGPSLAVAWEGGGTSAKRAGLYRDYKSGRARVESKSGYTIEGGKLVLGAEIDGFSLQQIMINLILHHLKIPACYAPGYEADDLLATWARLVSKHPGSLVHIYTTDRDLWQCISPCCSVICPDSNSNEDKTITLANLSGGHALGVVWSKVLRGDVSDTYEGPRFFWPSAKQGEGKTELLPPRMVDAILSDRNCPQTLDELIEYLKNPGDGSPLRSFPEFQVTDATIEIMRRNYALAKLNEEITDVQLARPADEWLAAFPTLQSVFDVLAMKKWSKTPELWQGIASARRHPVIQP